MNVAYTNKTHVYFSGQNVAETMWQNTYKFAHIQDVSNYIDIHIQVRSAVRKTLMHKGK